MKIQITITLYLGVMVLLNAADISPADLAFFESKIRPVFADNCYKCHAEDSKRLKGKLLLDTKAGWQRGGESGQVIIPGNAKDSLLFKMINHLPEVESMPKDTKLTAAQMGGLECGKCHY